MVSPMAAECAEKSLMRGMSLMSRLKVRDDVNPAVSSYEAMMLELESIFEWKLKEESFIPGTDGYKDLMEDDLIILDIPTGLRWHQWHGWEAKLTAAGTSLECMERAELCVLMSAEEGTIVVQAALSPSSRQMNSILHISDLLYLVWDRYCKERNVDPRGLKWIVRHNVFNKDTLNCVNLAWKQELCEETETRERISFPTDIFQGMMLLGCPNGLAGGHLLLEHGSVFNGKTIVKVDCIKVRDQWFDSMVVLKYWIGDL